MLKDPLDGPVDLKSELISKIGPLVIVIGDGFGPLGSGLRKELNRHG